jgi:predicted PurR-regulated permease PerM
MNESKPKLVRDRGDRASPETPITPATGVADPASAQEIFAAWMEDRTLSLYVLMVITTGAVYVIYLIFRPFLTSLFLALILAVTFFPVHKWFARWFRNTYFAALCTTGLALLIILVPFIFVGARLAAQATYIYSSVLQALRNPTLWPQALNPLLEKADDITGIPAAKLKADLNVYARQFASWLLRFGATFGRRLGQQIWAIALAFIFLVPLLRHGDEFRVGALSLLPLSRQRARELSLAIYEGIIADVYGVVAVGVAEGMLIAFGFWIVRLPSPLFWGTVAILLSCLPFFGVSMVWLPACVILAVQGQWNNALLLFVWCAIVVSTAEGMIRSRVVSGRARVNSMLIMLSIMGGLVTFGAVGIFVGPVVLVLVGTLVRILREEHATVHESRLRPAS